MIAYYIAGIKLLVEENLDFFSHLPLQFFQSKHKFIQQIFLAFSDNFTSVYSKQLCDAKGVIVSSVDDGWLFSCKDLSMHMSAQYTNLTLYGFKGVESREAEATFMQLLRTAMECCFTAFDRLTLHASLVDYQGSGLLFIAPSGTGKSTQAVFWKTKYGASIISGDRPSVIIQDENISASGVPWDGKEQLFIQKDLPVVAIIDLRQSPVNYIKRLNDRQAMTSIMSQTFLPMWDSELSSKAVYSLAVLSKSVPCYRLFCSNDQSSADLLHEVIYGKRTDLLKNGEIDMKIKPGFELRNTLDEYIVMPVGENINNYNGSIVLNDVGAFIWKILSKSVSKQDVVRNLLEEYEIDEEAAIREVDLFIKRLNELHTLDFDTQEAVYE